MDPRRRLTGFGEVQLGDAPMGAHLAQIRMGDRGPRTCDGMGRWMERAVNGFFFFVLSVRQVLYRPISGEDAFNDINCPVQSRSGCLIHAWIEVPALMETGKEKDGVGDSPEDMQEEVVEGEGPDRWSRGRRWKKRTAR
ncbi:unnamed protein product [Haemonchus placei]|uniref:Uncharacterized protein n=1 Tax=Haemonchus placei TaxID=6290 RepID=A0A0N4X2A6_HAEPC|nr:unnamed protein product [Haemonchus placei]